MTSGDLYTILRTSKERPTEIRTQSEDTSPEMERVQPKVLEGRVHTFFVASPEGTILNKLEWYKMGGEVSDRQWNAILGVLKVQGTNLDMNYLQKWAVSLNVTDLLERALVDAGLKA
jgi:hypothetical protein